MTTNNIKIALLKDEIITVERDISFHNTQVERMTEQLEALQGEVETLEEIQQVELDEEEQLIDEIKNPDDYANADLKDLESSQ